MPLSIVFDAMPPALPPPLLMPRFDDAADIAYNIRCFARHATRLRRHNMIFRRAHAAIRCYAAADVSAAYSMLDA